MAVYTAIDDSGLFMNTVLYTGTGSSNAITGVGFQPDLVWAKSRSNGTSNTLTDAVRGVTEEIYSESTSAEGTNANGLTAFGADGFTVGSDSGWNGSSRTFVAWNWKANGSGSSNTDGSINTASTSANTTAGFSISKYVGTGSNGTIGHGLGVVPKIYIVKNLDAVGKWWFFPSFLNDAAKYLDGFTSTGAIQTDGNGLTNSTLPTSSLISIGTSSTINISSDNIICYAFAEIAGYSKFSTYVGNGNADGTFVYTGFRPAMVIIKTSSNSGENWHLYDSKRANAFNPIETYLPDPSLASAEATTSSWGMDFLSNGIKLRGTGSGINGNGYTFIYMAFAEAPFVNSNGVPCNAR